LKVAAISDLHCRKDSKGKIRSLLDGVERASDVLVLAGDLTNRGLIQEMEVLLTELKSFKLPIIAVLGNHDHEADHAALLTKMMTGNGICVLESTTCLIGDTGFVGTKGFCGGFDEYRIQAFGEQAIKAFVQASIQEVLGLEDALGKLEGSRRIGVLHYSPIKKTLHGESPELYAFLGSSLIESAFDRNKTDVIFHGHAHHGSLSGETKKGIPVYNVSRFVRTAAGESPYLVYEV
jgi:Icc-related predicted phosphoesterase